MSNCVMEYSHILKAAESWADYRKLVEPLNNKQTGDCFEELTKCFLQTDPTYVTHLRHSWYRKDVPIDVREKLKLPYEDEGQDLVVETFEGEYWLVQSKYVTDESARLTRKDLSTSFDLAFNICEGITRVLVVTNGNDPGPKFSLYGDKVQFVTGSFWRNLEDDFFDRVHDFLDGELPPPTPFNPRPHQIEAINNAETHFIEEGNSRGKLIHPCGTGKSLIGYWIAERLQANTVLVAVPSLALIKQLLSVWAREAVANGQAVRWICVCSDETVRDSTYDDVAVHTRDLGVDVHTKPAEIASWLSRCDDGLNVIFSTYQSGRQLAQAVKEWNKSIDLAILDEAHKTVGNRDSLFSLLLYDDNVAIRNRVFMTATERRYKGQSDEIASMDDPDLYGGTFDLMTFKDAIENDPPILCDYDIVTICVTASEVAELIQQNLFVKPVKGKWDEEIEAQMLAAAIALRKLMDKEPVKHAVSFHRSIARAEAFRATQDKLTTDTDRYKKMDAFHVRGSMSTNVRDDQLKGFASSDRSLITNARCLTEGVDVPNIDCVLFADPKKSKLDIVQAVGRALRQAEGKKRGYVLIPVLLDQPLNEENADLSDTAFGDLLEIVRGLAANDERIIDYFKSVSAGRSTGGGGRGGIEIIIPDGVDIDAENFANSLELRIWSKVARLAWMPFEEAREFASKLELTTNQWPLYCAGKIEGLPPKPANIPSNPGQVYKGKGWQGPSHFLGYKTRGRGKGRTFLPFKEAREFARTLKIISTDWADYCAGRIEGLPPKPSNIPSTPRTHYKDKGWKGWPDFLGTSNTYRTRYPTTRRYRSHYGDFLPFEQAREFARTLNLTASNWVDYCAGRIEGLPPRPPNIPSHPQKYYKDKGWQGWPDFFGHKPKYEKGKDFLPFEEARELARTLKITSSNWDDYRAGRIEGLPPPSPLNIPSTPDKYYKDQGWQGWPDFLGSGSQFLPYEEAREFARTLKLTSSNNWVNYRSGRIEGLPPKPVDIPSNPNKYYKDKGWQGWPDFLGYELGYRHRKDFLPYEEAREFARTLKLTSQKKWEEYSTGRIEGLPPRPLGIPYRPNKYYEDKGWQGWPDFLGYESRYGRDFLLYEEAREFTRKLKLTSSKEWKDYKVGKIEGLPPRPLNIPSNPNLYYKDKGWQGWPDFLGNKPKQNKKKS